jgi:hypothetical protein
MPGILDRTPQEQYGIDFIVKMQEALPYLFQVNVPSFDKKTVFVEFAEVLFAAYQLVNVAFVDFVAEIRNRLSFTGQVLSLTTFLNNTFDNTLKRITIECLNNASNDALIVFNNGEEINDNLTIYNNGETVIAPVTFWTNSDVDTPILFGVDFIINVPSDVTASDDIIEAFANIYVIAPQNYNIIRF